MYGKKTELAVGVFMLAGMAALAYLSVRLGDIELFGTRYSTVKAIFNSVTGLREGASVEIAGVNVGRVKRIYLDDDSAVVEMEVQREIKLPDDTIAAVRTKGVIGDKYIKLVPGGSEEYIENGGTIVDTESAISLEELISKYIFEK